MQAVSGLSQLTRLHVSADSEGDALIPRCEELACLRSNSIQDLSIILDKVLEGGLHCG